MPSKWPEVSIGEVAEKVAMGPFGSSIKVETFVLQGVPVISGQHLRGVRLADTEYNFISSDHAQRLANANVHRGDVVFTHAGNVGQVAYIPEDSKYERYVISQRQFYLRCDRRRLLPEFVAYYFRTPAGQHSLKANMSPVGVPSLAQPVSYLRTVRVPLPPLPVQRAIARVLGALDDKIELNRKMNETLEQMARALFKSWFVDFEPVRAKAEGRWQRGQSLPGLPAHLYDLFPDSFEDSPLGKIPKGWRAGAVNDVCTLEHDAVAPMDSPDEVFAHFSIPAFDSGKEPIEELGADIKSNKNVVPANAVLLSKLNPRFPRVWYADVPTNKRAIASTEFLVAIPITEDNREYLYSLFTSRSFMTEFEQMVTGTSSSHQRVPADSLLSLGCVIPDGGVMRQYGRLLRPMLTQVLQNIRQSRTLSAIRDALLPKLMSGEIEVRPE